MIFFAHAKQGRLDLLKQLITRETVNSKIMYEGEDHMLLDLCVLYKDALDNDGMTALALEIRSWEYFDEIEDTSVIMLLMEHGARVENVKLSKIPAWIHAYQRELDQKRRACAAACPCNQGCTQGYGTLDDASLG